MSNFDSNAQNNYHSFGPENESVQTYDDFLDEFQSANGQMEIRCPLHKRRMSAFCTLEKEIICVQCIFENHKSHDVKNVDEVLEGEKKSLEIAAKLLKPIESKLRERLGELDENKTKLERSQVVISKNLEELFTELAESLRSAERLMGNFVEEFFNDEFRRLEEQKGRTNQNLEQIEGVYSSYNISMTKPKPYEILHNSHKRFDFLSTISREANQNTYPIRPPDLEVEKIISALTKYFRVTQGIDKASQIKVPPAHLQLTKRDILGRYLDYLFVRGSEGLKDLGDGKIKGLNNRLRKRRIRAI